MKHIHLGYTSDFLEVSVKGTKTIEVAGVNNLGKVELFGNIYYQVVVTEVDTEFEFHILLSETDFDTLWDDLCK